VTYQHDILNSWAKYATSIPRSSFTLSQRIGSLALVIVKIGPIRITKKPISV